MCEKSVPEQFTDNLQFKTTENRKKRAYRGYRRSVYFAMVIYRLNKSASEKNLQIIYNSKSSISGKTVPLGK